MGFREKKSQFLDAITESLHDNILLIIDESEQLSNEELSEIIALHKQHNNLNFIFSIMIYEISGVLICSKNGPNRAKK